MNSFTSKRGPYSIRGPRICITHQSIRNVQFKEASASSQSSIMAFFCRDMNLDGLFKLLQQKTTVLVTCRQENLFMYLNNEDCKAKNKVIMSSESLLLSS